MVGPQHHHHVQPRVTAGVLTGNTPGTSRGNGTGIIDLMEHSFRRPDEDARVAQTKQLILTAARRLLLDEGQEAVTPTRLTQITGISRSTIYRHWNDPGEIVFEATAVSIDDLPFTPTGDIRHDLTAYLQDLRSVLQSNQATLLATQIDRAEHNADNAATLSEIASARRELIKQLLDDPTDDFSSIHALIVGPLIFQRFMARKPITDDLIDQVVDNYLKVRTAAVDSRVNVAEPDRA